MMKRKKRFTKKYRTAKEKRLKKLQKCLQECEDEKPWIAPCEMGCFDEYRKNTPRM